MSIISVYKIEGEFDDTDWTMAWRVEEESYGIDVICRNVLESDAGVEDEIAALQNLSIAKSNLRELLKSEFHAGTTHAFVQPLEGKALYGVSLHQIFG